MKKLFIALLAVTLIITGACSPSGSTDDVVDLDDPAGSYEIFCNNLSYVLQNEPISCKIESSMTTAANNENNVMQISGEYAADLTDEAEYRFSGETQIAVDGFGSISAVYCNDGTYSIFTGDTVYRMPTEERVYAELYKTVYPDLPVTSSSTKKSELKKTDDGYSFSFELSTSDVSEYLSSEILGNFNVPTDSMTYSAITVSGTVDNEYVVSSVHIDASGKVYTTSDPVGVIISTDMTFDPLDSGYEFSVPEAIANCQNVNETTYEAIYQMYNASSVAE